MEGLILTNNISYLQIKGKEKQNKVLIFLPGLGAYKENYIEYAKCISSFYQCIYLIDLPQQGSKGEWTIGTMVDNLKLFVNKIDSKEIQEIHLAGHSAGAVAIISFLLNITKEVESFLLKKHNTYREYRLLQLMENKGFIKEIPEAKKVTKLFLYSPCDAFEHVFPKFLVKKLERIHERTAKIILDLCVNKPMKLLKYISHKKHLNFALNKRRKPQYFGLVMDDYKSFFNYIYNCKCIFELVQLGGDNLKEKIRHSLKNKKVVVQYGSIDWLLISKNRCKKTMRSNFKFCESIKIIEHKYLGHFLYKSFSLDINLNNQMLINKNVVKHTLLYL